MIEPGDLEKKREAEVTNRQARRTAFVVGGVLMLLAAWNLYRGRHVYVYALGVTGAALFLTGSLLPGAARRFHIFWMKAASVLGHVNSRVLLSLMFYGVFTPYGLAMRLFGRDVLRRRPKSRGESYWMARKTTRQTKEQFERLF